MVYGHMMPKYPLADFSVNLYQHAGTSSESMCLSPLSLSLALAMIFYGSAGNTKSQIKGAMFGFSSTDQQVSTYMGEVMKTINSTDKTFILYAVNRLYINKKYNVSDYYRNKVKDKLNSDIAMADFSNPRKVVSEINHWVATATHYKIKDLVTTSSFDANTRLAVINAVYFNSKWLKEFSPHDTSKGTFYVSMDRRIEVDMMSQKKLFSYGETAECQVLAMRYIGPFMSMVVLLPKERYGLRRFEEALTARKLVQLLSSTTSTTVTVKFPKFQLQSKLKLNSIFESMGITDMFRKTADLAAITGKPELFVSSGVHEAFIQVDERGTEAAAATGFEIMPMAAVPNQEVRFIADHPFMFAIIDKKHNNILFLGRYVGRS
ncbi:unnamed protein product [Soboliphyme baturini]|uniref:SERPIN domain-containing protein n=1 Tax=Soboliphyme baturini TaxID=241478 RepID=A0A183ID20_9BILA|nr:unnamed protein product [Soboliphyme baturini]